MRFDLAAMPDQSAFLVFSDAFIVPLQNCFQKRFAVKKRIFFVKLIFQRE